MEFDVCLATDWEYDKDFLSLLNESLCRRNLGSLLVWPHNLESVLQALRSGSMGFRFVLDRGSATSPEFLELYRLLSRTGARFLDDPDSIRWASDKATMHLEFISAGIHVPYTLILAPFNSAECIPLSPGELSRIGSPFFVKPANTTGGGIGVFEHGTCLEDVLAVRQQHKADKYLVQERIYPLEKEGRRFWFRVFHVCGSFFATWWHDLSHVYQPLLPEQVECYGLEPLFTTARVIARVCRLNFFSTELVLDRSGRWVAVDYVNDSCDLRLKSRHDDGVPDQVVRQIAEHMADFILAETRLGCQFTRN
jgi:hypothetical protein